jgi:SAM-dependent methyltransferase
MQFTEILGIAAPEIGWVPAPSYILRRSAVLHILRHAEPGRVLEIGCGGGALLCLASRLLADSPGMTVRPSMVADDERFDYLMAFEVLEHIEDDTAALNTWAQYLRSGGTLLLSVPARMRSWGDSDVWAGHFRRYERDDLRSKVSTAGFEVERLVAYGWPLSNLVEPVRTSVNRRRLRDAEKHGRDPLRDKRTQTEGSGIERQIEARLYPYYANWFGQMGFKFFCAFQRCFFARDWGTGYILVGRKK